MPNYWTTKDIVGQGPRVDVGGKYLQCICPRKYLYPEFKKKVSSKVTLLRTVSGAIKQLPWAYI